MDRFLFILLFSGVLGLTGCGATIRDFVGGIPELGTAPAANALSKELKVSPGAVLSSGAQVSSRVTVTPTQVVAVGLQVKAKLSLSQSRME